MVTRLHKLALCLTAGAMICGLSLSAEGAKPSSKPAAKKVSTSQATPARDTSKATSSKATTSKAKTYSASGANARKAQLARARAAARSRELRDVQTPRFRVDEFGREVPDVRAEAAIIYNPQTGEVLWEDHAQDRAIDGEHHQGDDRARVPR